METLAFLILTCPPCVDVSSMIPTGSDDRVRFVAALSALLIETETASFEWECTFRNDLTDVQIYDVVNAHRANYQTCLTLPRLSEADRFRWVPGYQEASRSFYNRLRWGFEERINAGNLDWNPALRACLDDLEATWDLYESARSATSQYTSMFQKRKALGLLRGQLAPENWETGNLPELFPDYMFIRIN